MEKGNCPVCGTALLWVQAEAHGRIMALDADPSPQGDYALLDGQAVSLVYSLFEPILPPGPRYSEHTRHCPAYKRKGPQ